MGFRVKGALPRRSLTPILIFRTVYMGVAPEQDRIIFPEVYQTIDNPNPKKQPNP